MNANYATKIVLGLLILLLGAAGCKQKRSQSAHYMNEKEWRESYQKRMKQDEQKNIKKRNQPNRKQ